MLKKISTIYDDFPGTFWTLIVALFVDRLGGALLFPFFALYVTQKFNVGMTEVGGLFAIFATMSILGGVVSGALTDKWGRRWMIIFGLVMSALSSLSMAFVEDLRLFYLLAIFVGLVADSGQTAQQAMVADLLPSEKHAEGYGILRIAHNLAVATGPLLGGLLAAQSFLLLFVADAVTSLITAVVVYRKLPETKPTPSADQPSETLWQTLGGYRHIWQDKSYIAFLGISLLALLVYIQMYSTLSVYLRDVHGIPAQGFGLIMSLNAGMVVLFQFWITRRVTKLAPMLMMALGTLLYAVGFALYGFVTTLALFMLAMVVITLGEMVTVPVAQALAAQFAPETMRGRYLAVFGFTWTLSTALGPTLAGLIMDNYAPNLVWYAGGLVAMVAVIGYLWLHWRVGDHLNQAAPLTPQPVASE